MALTVRQFIFQSYRLINASSPTIPLYSDDQSLGLTVLNQLLDFYAATGLLLTIAKFATTNLIAGQTEVVVGPPTFLPLPNITLGRMANLDSAWLELDGVTYPLIDGSRDEFLASFRFDPLMGLPRFVIVYPDTEVVRLRLYPGPSQFFTFNMRAKFQLTNLTINDDLASLPAYYVRFFLLAVAKDIALFKGRADAWTDKLEAQLVQTQQIMEAASEVNLTITGDRASLLNANWRVMAGI